MSEIAGLPERIRFSAAADLVLFFGQPGKEEPVNQEEVCDLVQTVVRKKEAEPHYEGETNGTRIRIPFFHRGRVEGDIKGFC